MAWRGGYDWRVERKEYMRGVEKLSIRKIEIDGVTYVFRVDSNDTIMFVVSPRQKAWTGALIDATSVIGMTVNQFIQTMTSPLYIADPIVPSSEYLLHTTLGKIVTPAILDKLSPAAFDYFEKLARRFAEYLSSLYMDWEGLRGDALGSTKAYTEFAIGLMRTQTDNSMLPFALAEQFIINAPEGMTASNQNIHMFFKELTEEVYLRAPESSYEELFASYHDAQILTDERLRGTLRLAEERGKQDNFQQNTIKDVPQLENQRRAATIDLISLMMTELNEARKHAFATGNETAVRRMDDLSDQIDMFIDDDSSAFTLDKLISREPEFTIEIRQKVADLMNVSEYMKENRIVDDPQPYRLSVSDVRQIDAAKRLADSTKDKYYQESALLISQLEAEGHGNMDRAVTQMYPHLSRNWLEAQRNTQFGYDPDQGIKFADEEHRNRMYGIKGNVLPVPRLAKVKGTIFDKTGKLVKSLAPPSPKFKMTRPDRSWHRKLYQGVLDIKLTIKDFRVRETGAVNMAILDHLFQRFGGDANAFGKLKKAFEEGVDIANMHAWYAMLPTFTQMVHQETGHFQGMDKLRAGKRGVFYEFIEPTVNDITINSRKPFNAHINLRWARINTSRSLAFYRDKQGLPAGERRRRVEQLQSLIDAHKAKPSSRTFGRAVGIGRGMIKENRAQQFIIQKYLTGDKRTFLENMDKQQMASSTRREISALFGDEAGQAVRAAVRSGESSTLALARHLRAQPGDRIHVFMNENGDMGLTVSKSKTAYPPGTYPVTSKADAESFTAVPTQYKRITSITVPVYQQTEPMEPVSDSFRGAMRAIAAGGYSGNIFQRLANILWNIDVPLPDWDIERVSLKQSQIEQVTTWLRDRTTEIDTKLNQGVAEERAGKTITDRVLAPAVDKIVQEAAKLSSTDRILMNQVNRLAPGMIDEKYIVGLTI
ncbi:hypothetical protein KAR91_56905 [Candidatus Pacearchaeota archaeon]|nr:hypothetical protein [Candidatus Pacearchaeota archaeon]